MTKIGLSVKEAAQLLGIHPNTLYRAVWRGELKAVKIGTRLILPKGELERLLGYPLGAEKEASALAGAEG
jgi:excisionase family DNA binding protein